MNDFNWNNFTKRIFINVDKSMVYDAWTKSKELERWFLSRALFYSKSGKEIESTENVKSDSKYSWTWYAQDFSERGTVINANGMDSFEFSFAGECIVQIQLIQEGKQTLVVLTQKEIPEDDFSKKNIRLGCAFGWTFYLTNLKSVLEGGLDLRNKDTKLVGVVNN